MNYVVIDGEKILVKTAYQCCKINRKTKTLIINQEHYLRKNDTIGFSCSNCNIISEQKFRFKMKFLYPMLCASCNKSINNPYKKEDVKEKIKQIKLKKYGNPIFTNREKAKKTMSDKYGVEYALQSKMFIEKLKQTNLEKYGTDVYNKSIVAKQKNEDKFYNRLVNSERLQNKVAPLFNKNEYNGSISYKKYKWKCKTCKTIFYYHIENGCIPRCPKCFPRNAIVSEEELKLFNYLKHLSVKIINNDRELIKPYEIDFYLPTYKLAIEFNGIYWHSDKVNSSKNYHQNKVKMCNDKGIRLIHVWEDEWLQNQDEVKEKILYYIDNLDEKIKPREPILEERMGFRIWT